MTSYKFQAPFVFDNFVYLKGLGLKEKIKLPFKGFSIILFQNILLLKEFLACNGYFGIFTKLIKRSGSSFCSIFSAWVFHKKYSLFDTPSMDKVSMSYLFSFSRYQAKCVIQFLFRHMMAT